jgi:hypothetical protein
MTNTILKVTEQTTKISIGPNTVFNIKTEELKTDIVELGTQGPEGIQGEQGIQGEKGDKGDKGDTGSGVAAGGASGDALFKTSSNDYETEFRKIAVSDVDTLSATVAEMKNRLTNALTTNILSGCLLTWVDGGSVVNISAGKILFATSYPDKLNPTYTIVDYPGVTGLTPQYLATELGTFFYIDSTGTLIEQPGTIDY